MERPTASGRPWVWLVPAVIGGVFLWFVWPTPYEYTRKAPDVFRINRFTGVREVSTARGWRFESDLQAEARAVADAEYAKRREADRIAAERRETEKRALQQEKSLTSFELRGVKASCVLSYLDYQARFRVTLEYKGAVKRAYESGYRSSFYIDVDLEDRNGFAIGNERVTLSEFTGVIGDKEKVEELEYEGSVFLTEDKFKQIVDWHPEYNW